MLLRGYLYMINKTISFEPLFTFTLIWSIQNTVRSGDSSVGEGSLLICEVRIPAAAGIYDLNLLVTYICLC